MAGDFVRYDCSLTDKMLSLEFKSFLALDPKGAELYAFYTQADEYAVTKSGSKFHYPKNRRSGEPSTSLFNTYIQELVYKFIINKYMLSGVDFIIEGDDSLISAQDEATLQFIATTVQRLGFDFEYKISDKGLEGLDFCKQYFFRCPGSPTGWTMFKNPGSQLFKLGISTKAPANHRSGKTYELIRSKVYSACAEAYGLAICDVVLQLLKPEDRNPTFEQVIEAHKEHNPDADQWSICSIQKYTDSEIELYQLMYGDDLDQISAVFTQWQSETMPDRQADERRQLY